MPEKVLLYGESTPLVGVLTTPDAPAPDPERPVFVILNAGIVHRVGPNRLHVRIARRMAKAGFTTLRFDFAGVGDSPARRDGLSMADGVARDVDETLDLLERTTGARRFVVLGLCSGADNALRTGARDPRVVGLVMLDPTVWRTRRWYLRHYALRAARPAVWRDVVTGRHPVWKRLERRASALRPGGEPAAKPEIFQTGYLEREAMRDAYASVVDRRVQLFVTFTGSWDFIYNYRTQLYDSFSEVPFDGMLRLDYHPDTNHTFSREQDQRQLCDRIAVWARTAPFTRADERPGADRRIP